MNQRDSQRRLPLAGVVLLSVAIGACLLLGTFGCFAVGLRMMTDCTNNYSCTEISCTPCASASRWINTGGAVQIGLALGGAVLLVIGLRSSQRDRLVLSGVVLLTMSAATAIGTTWRASESYCQPATRGYAASYCSTN